MGLITFFLNLSNVFEAKNSSLKNQSNANEILITNTLTENAEKNENEIEREF